MREILFRGKANECNNEEEFEYGEWVEGLITFVGSYNGIYSATILTDEYDECQVDPETVGQYTGLTDKNGVKIFEGDIVTGYFNHEKIIGTIIYGSDATFFIQRNGLFGIGLNNATDWLSVIGNIHDNPELLEVNNE